MPDLKLFAEIFRFLNLLFFSNFLTISERLEIVKHFPDSNRKIGRFCWKNPAFFADFFNFFMALIGQKCLSGKAKRSIISDLPAIVFGFLTLIDIFDLVLKIISAQEQVEDGSKACAVFVSSSLARKEPKYPTHMQAQTTFLLWGFQFFFFRISFNAIKILKVKGSVGLKATCFSDLWIPRTSSFAVSFMTYWLLSPKNLEIVCNAER